MATHCQTAVGSRRGERQNKGAISSFVLKAKNGCGQLQTKNQIANKPGVTMCLFSL